MGAGCSAAPHQRQRTSGEAAQKADWPPFCMAAARMTLQLAAHTAAWGWFSLKASAAGCSYSMAHLHGVHACQG